MNKAQIEEVTREIETMAIINRKHACGAVSARRIDFMRRRRDGSFIRSHRIDWFINGNRVPRRDAACFLAA